MVQKKGFDGFACDHARNDQQVQKPANGNLFPVQQEGKGANMDIARIRSGAELCKLGDVDKGL